MAIAENSIEQSASRHFRRFAAYCCLATLFTGCQSTDIKNLRLAPKGADYAHYEWSNSEWALTVQNPRPGSPADTFPEPPLTVTSRRASATCNIDGGIWSRDHFYIRLSRPVLIVLESSGSNDWLALYSLETCQKLREIDVTGSKWKITTHGEVSIEDQNGRRIIGTLED